MQVTKFDGPPVLTTAVGHLFRMQVWRTLRGSDGKRSFGQAWVYALRLPEKDVGKKSRAESPAARMLARGLGADFNIGVSVNGTQGEFYARAFLMIAPEVLARSNLTVWSIKVRSKQEASSPETITTGLPQRTYQFYPIKLTSKFVERYRNAGAILIYDEKRKRHISDLDNVWSIVYNRNERFKFVLMMTDDAGKELQGYAYLPELNTRFFEVTNFVGGLIRLYRQDYRGAITLFRSLAKSRYAPAGLRKDAMLLTIRAKNELGRDARREIRAVLKIAPPSRRVVRYLAMYYLRYCYAPERKLRRLCRSRDRQNLRDLLASSQPLFPKDDVWYRQAANVAGTAF